MEKDADFILENGKIIKIEGRNAYLKKWNIYPNENNNEWKVFINSEDEVKYAPCPYCGGEHILIRELIQMYDSPQGDTWRESFLIICPKQLKIFRIYETYS